RQPDQGTSSHRERRDLPLGRQPDANRPDHDAIAGAEASCDREGGGRLGAADGIAQRESDRSPSVGAQRGGCEDRVVVIAGRYCEGEVGRSAPPSKPPEDLLILLII